MIVLAPHADGVLLSISAQPGGKKNELRPPVDGRLKVVVTQAAEKGKANQAITKLLAKSLKLKHSQLELISGATSKNKTFLVRGHTATDLEARIAMAVAR